MGKKPIQQTRFHIKYGTARPSGEYKMMCYKNQTYIVTTGDSRFPVYNRTKMLRNESTTICL